MARDWSPEARAQFGERMRAAKSGSPDNGSPALASASSTRRRLKPSHSETEDPISSAPNPIATDVLPPPVQKRPRSIPKPAAAAPTLTPAQSTTAYAVADLIADLESIPLPDISYADCGLLLNALSACSTSVALARRQKQEQLEAGTHRAPCKTCGRMIDISKAGGFQILTERDEHHMPKNTYYCSQNCLLARNMPSHAKQTSKEKKENRA